MSNLSILERNTLAGFSEASGILYLKLLDVFAGNERKALFAADRYERLCGGTLDYILRNMPGAPDEQVRRDLLKFFSERWRHNFMERAA